MSVIQRRNPELVEILRPDFVGNDGAASPTFAAVNVGTTGAGTGTARIRGSADNAVLEGLRLTNSDWETTETGQAIDLRFCLRRGAPAADRIAAIIRAGKDDDYDVAAACDSYLAFFTTLNDSATERLRINSLGNIYPGGNKTQDLGLSGTAWDDCWADDFQNEPDYYYMDSRRNRAGEVVPVDDLAVIRGIRASGEWDGRTGLPLIDDSSLPEWIFTRDKRTGETLYGPDGKPWLSLKITTSLSWGAIRQLDGYRLVADAEREAIRTEIAGLQKRLDQIEGRG